MDIQGLGTHRRYSDAFKERAVAMVLQARAEAGVTRGHITRVAGQLGCGTESLRTWVKQAEIDSGRRAGTSSSDADKIARLERENRELRRANDILKAASAFFAAELDRPHKR